MQVEQQGQILVALALSIILSALQCGLIYTTGSRMSESSQKDFSDQNTSSEHTDLDISS